MTPDQFQEIVDRTLKELPSEFASKMENVDILVEDWPTIEQMHLIKAHPSRTLLFGLYSGIPKTKRVNYSAVLPDKITIFAGPILMVSKDLKDAHKRIKDTVLHEIGHHFGLSDREIYRAQREKHLNRSNL